MEEIFNLLAFESTHVAVKCENILNNKGIYNKIIGIPSQISSGCGLALKIRLEDFKQVMEIFDEEKKVTTCYKIVKNGLEMDIEKI